VFFFYPTLWFLTDATDSSAISHSLRAFAANLRAPNHYVGEQAPGRHKEQVQELIGTLRKAFTQQKNLEESLRQAQLPVEYRWSLNEAEMPVPSREIK